MCVIPQSRVHLAAEAKQLHPWLQYSQYCLSSYIHYILSLLSHLPGQLTFFAFALKIYIYLQIYWSGCGRCETFCTSFTCSLTPTTQSLPKKWKKKICVKWIEKAFFVNIDKNTFEFLKYSGYAADTKACNPINW